MIYSFKTMSYRQQSRKSPYCATCERAGQPESVYRGHFTKDAPGGKVVCPTIMEFKCKECGESGHIANEKYCPVLREYAAADRLVRSATQRAERVLFDEKNKTRSVGSNKKPVVTSNRFALAFDADSDSDEEKVATKTVAKVAVATKVAVAKDEFPVLGLPCVVGGGVPVRSYKDMLEKPIVLEKKDEIVLNFHVLSSSVRATPFKVSAKFRRSWADDTSSDEEED